MKKLLYHAVLPLITGLAIYILLREPITNLHQALGITRNLSPIPSSPFTRFVLFHLPDVLWAYALTASLLLITTLKGGAGATLALLLLSTVECVQANWQLKYLDWTDLAWMCVSVLLAILLIKK